MRRVIAMLSWAWSIGWLLGRRFGWDTLLTAAIVVVGSAYAVLMVG